MLTSCDVRFLAGKPQALELCVEEEQDASVLNDAIVALQRQVEEFDQSRHVERLA
jgi:hypothetical protein